MDKETKELMEMLAGLVERNTSAINRVSAAVEANIEKNEKLAAGMQKMTAVITGAQRKIGGELGSVIEKQKETQRKIAQEGKEQADAASKAEERRGANARP